MKTGEEEGKQVKERIKNRRTILRMGWENKGRKKKRRNIQKEKKQEGKRNTGRKR